MSNQKYNAYLKEVADICGIPKTLTSHVGRKTFSIGLALRSSVSIELLSALLGHSSILVTTDYYAKVTDEIMIDGVKNLAEQLKKIK
jgi:integrase